MYISRVSWLLRRGLSACVSGYEKIRRLFALLSLSVELDAGRHVVVEFPRKISNPKYIKIGNNVRIGPGSFINAVMLSDGESLKIQIGDGVVATSTLQIHSARSVIISDGVLFGANVFISDFTHEYSTPIKAYSFQGYAKPLPVHLGEGVWVGQNVVILPGVSVGDFSIIGANSVVITSIPPRSIAAGVPAKVLKTWSNETSSWVQVK